MMAETERIIHHDIDFLPLKSYTNIAEGNALRMDWETVVPKDKLNYIMGNPPFVGFTYMTPEQKADVAAIYPGIKNIDYVSCWFKKACDFTRNSLIECAFVSTNSVTQGETIGRIWESIDITINFAHTTFKWDSEAHNKAHVHCVIIGFAHKSRKYKFLYNDDGVVECKNINPYLVNAPNVIVKSRNKALCDVPQMMEGSLY